VKQKIIKSTSQFFSEEGEGIFLTDYGKKIFLKEWEKWMNFEHYHQRLKRVVSHREMIRLELYKFIKPLYALRSIAPM
jgi:CRISPR-associated protein Cas1